MARCADAMERTSMYCESYMWQATISIVRCTDTARKEALDKFHKAEKEGKRKGKRSKKIEKELKS